MKKLCPYCDETYQTSNDNQIACNKDRCKQQHISERMKFNYLRRSGKETSEDLEDLDRGSFPGFYTYMKKRPFYFQSLSAMLPTHENIKEYFYSPL